MSKEKAAAAVLDGRRLGSEDVERLAEQIYRAEQESRMGKALS